LVYSWLTSGFPSLQNLLSSTSRFILPSSLPEYKGARITFGYYFLKTKTWISQKEFLDWPFLGRFFMIFYLLQSLSKSKITPNLKNCELSKLKSIRENQDVCKGSEVFKEFLDTIAKLFSESLFSIIWTLKSFLSSQDSLSAKLWLENSFR